MVIKEFPPVTLADEHGLLAVGGDLEPESLLLAYSSGIFPWPVVDDYITWFAPPQRALLFFDHLHIPRSLEKFRRKSAYKILFDRNFESVIRKCAEITNRKDQGGTWITKEIIAGYLQLHREGYCHSIECYDGDELIGGLYGVSIGGMFAGESMFYRKPNASKLALLFLLDHLKNAGYQWMDCQQLTPTLETLGAIEIPREQFMELLPVALSGRPASFENKVDD